MKRLIEKYETRKRNLELIGQPTQISIDEILEDLIRATHKQKPTTAYDILMKTLERDNNDNM